MLSIRGLGLRTPWGDMFRTSLESMIDSPLREPVALLNLLGCRTIWSCCGFHYRGEPKGKSHMLGNTQILIHCDPRSFEVVTRLFDNHEAFAGYPKWRALIDSKPFQGAALSLVFGFPVSKEDDWWNPNSPHAHEGPAGAIQHLTNALWAMESQMVDEVVVTDQNAVAKEQMKSWDFPASKPWTIRKANYFPKIVAKIEVSEALEATEA